jgi:hypothetical protein
LYHTIIVALTGKQDADLGVLERDMFADVLSKTDSQHLSENISRILDSHRLQKTQPEHNHQPVLKAA